MNPVRKIASLLLLLLLFTTSTGFSMYTVLCPMTGESYSSSFEKHCCCQDTGGADKCCHEEAKFLRLDIETSISELRMNFDAIFFVAGTQYQINRLFPDKDLNNPKYLNYTSPLIKRDIPVLVQSFLI